MKKSRKSIWVTAYIVWVVAFSIFSILEIYFLNEWGLIGIVYMSTVCAGLAILYST